MSGFKSFGDRTVTIQLSSGFTCIVGPNGAGKSNIIDALTFALGRLSKKTMRAKSLEDLIFAGSRGKNPSQRAKVTLFFDNSENLFPAPGDTFQVSRIIKRGGGGGYKMNGKTTTRQQILNALAAANIDPDGTNQFVLQGKIVELTHMNPENRRSFIEELIGLQKYDEMKDATMKELEKAERDLGQFEAIFKEVSSQLKKVEKEKNDALAWKELDEQIKFYNAQLIALKISKLREEEESLQKNVEETSKIIEEFEEKITRQEEVLKQESLLMDNIQKTITEKEKEREIINENITQLKTQLSAHKTSLEIAKKSINKYSNEILSLESQQMKLEEGQTYDSIINEINNNISETEKLIEASKQEIETSQQNQADLDNEIKSKNEEQNTFKSDISNVKQKISSDNAQIKIFKENIKKNEEKKLKLEEDLKKLKGEAESTEEAIEVAKKEEKGIREKIDELKLGISKENQNQKELENQIKDLQDKQDKLNSDQLSLQSTLSSLTTEIKMNNNRIIEMQDKKNSIENEIKTLSEGKDTEIILKELMIKRKTILADLNKLKNEYKQENSTFKKYEQDLELLLMKQDSIESEIYDNKAKIENLNTKLKLTKRDFTNLEREKRDNELKINSLKINLNKLNKDKENLNNKKVNIERRLDELLKEKKELSVKIEKTEDEYERNTEDVTGILQILNMLTQNINISVESIKSNIQQSNAEAIETSADDFRKFVLDIVDIMKTVEDVSSTTEEESEASKTINSILQTLSMFTDNVDSTIDQLISKVKESADVEIQESTTNFDNFVQDLMEILENVYISLRKLTMSKSQDLYKELEAISLTITSQTDDLNAIENKLIEININKKRDTEDLSILNKRLEQINKRIAEANEIISQSEEEIKQRTNQISEKEKKNYKDEIKDLKDLKSKYWENIESIQEKIDVKQKELDDLQDKLQELRGIQSLFDNIIEIEANIKDLNASNDSKKDTIDEINTKIDSVNKEKKSIDLEINDLITKKDQFWENTENLQAKIDEQNKILEETMDKIRSLDNIMMIINSIEELTKENSDAKNNIEISKKNIDENKLQIENLQSKVDDVQKEIDKLRETKSKEVENQKAAQKKLNKLNNDLQKTQKELNEIKKNKERENKISALNQDINDTEKEIEKISDEIQKIEENLSKEKQNKDLKQKELNQFIQQKDESWNKQKNYQRVIADLKSDFSMENSKLNNYESKIIITKDQIETLYHRSKDFGAIPPVTDDLSEAELLSDISEATKKKKTLEPVNLKAIEQYDTVKERFDEIDMRRQTIQRERKSILDAIEKIELEKTRTFMKAYHEINREFSRIFQKLSPGGSAKMILDRPDKPFEGGVSIEARPRGKKISSLEILSGGEKTLVALSFIFAVQEFMPSPFYVLDEIDAALDGPNVHRVSMLLKEFAKQAQFLVISHREENIVNADRIYGVTMQQSGITDIFSVDLEEEAKKLLELPDIPTNIEEN